MINFPLSTYSTASHTFWCYIFISFYLKYFYFSFILLSNVLFRSVQFNFQIFGDNPNIFMGLVSRLIILWYEKTLYMIYTLLDFLRYVSWLQMYFILMNCPCEFENNVYLAVVRWSLQEMSIRPITLRVVFRSTLVFWQFYCPIFSLDFFPHHLVFYPTIPVVSINWMLILCVKHFWGSRWC